MDEDPTEILGAYPPHTCPASHQAPPAVLGEQPHPQFTGWFVLSAMRDRRLLHTGRVSGTIAVMVSMRRPRQRRQHRLRNWLRGPSRLRSWLTALAVFALTLATGVLVWFTWTRG